PFSPEYELARSLQPKLAKRHEPGGGWWRLTHLELRVKQHAPGQCNRPRGPSTGLRMGTTAHRAAWSRSLADCQTSSPCEFLLTSTEPGSSIPFRQQRFASHRLRE